MKSLRGGFIIPTVLAVLAVVAVIVTAAVVVGVSNRTSTSVALRASAVQLAAEAGLADAVKRLWYDVWAKDTGKQTVARYRDLLDKPPVGGITYADTMTVNFKAVTLGSGLSYEVSVTRQDTDRAVRFRVRSTGRRSGGDERTLVQDMYVQDTPYAGVDFAMYTGNMNCIMCHLDVKPLEALKGPPSTTNPWPVTRVGAIDSIAVWKDASDTRIAGSLFTRGQIVNEWDNQELRPSETGIKTLLVPGQTTITSSTPQDFTAADCARVATCKERQNFYKNYPSSSRVNLPASKGGFDGVWPAGVVPDRFPPVVPDLDGNRVTDQSEWDAVVKASRDGQDPQNPFGSLSAVALVNPSGVTGWPTGSVAKVESGSKANLVLDGTTTPITIEGTVYVDGDVVLRGRIKGNGKLVVRGNAYVMGDLVYACGVSNSPCTDADYARPETLPSFALASSGNIMVGDYLTPRGGDTLDRNSLETGNVWKDAGGGRNDAAGFTWRQAGIFNQLELKRALEDDDYRPRLYRLRGSATVDFKNSPNLIGADKYDEADVARLDPACVTNAGLCPKSDLTLKVTGRDVKLNPARLRALLTRATFSSLSPTSAWLSEPQLKGLWIDSIESNLTRPRGALRTDGLLYSSNAVFSITRRNGNLKGAWDLRGALVADDAGILAPGDNDVNSGNSGRMGLTLYHDRRMTDFLRVRDDEEVALMRSDWSLEK
ncbi:polymer-forming cytoskeletal protein [Deinococcus pimensis]|uniref:polymer-forming cytoskeletal protein n=1 Tax=Deinococcus pimensis TaxID=309888 RepID=UPI000488A10D|nr:polymer-forming cytoskeletal protein [Deinococcus pimensis]